MNIETSLNDAGVPITTSAHSELSASPSAQDAAQNARTKSEWFDFAWSQDGAPNKAYLGPDCHYEGAPDTKFYKDYPPDPWGEEAAPNARIWKIYRDELTNADAAALKSWNDTLDVLLIFAGLFSAVSTAFIIESYKSLQPDYTQYIAHYLYANARSNVSLKGDGTAFPTSDSLGPPDSFVRPSSMQRWTNGLWFTSLVVSLTVALLCILIKQWLDVYRARTTRSASSLRDWARRHQLYYRGLNSWGVPVLISLLPLMVHASLFLFFAGLVLFLRPLDGAIATTLLLILSLTLLFYVLCLLVPAWRVECPSYTPLLAQAQSLILIGLGFLAYLSRALSFPRSFRLHVEGFLERNKARFKREQDSADVQKYELEGRALATLLASTNNADILNAGVDAIGALSTESALDEVVRGVPKTTIDERIFKTIPAMEDLDFPHDPFSVMSEARRVRTQWTILMARVRLCLGGPNLNRSMIYLSSFLGLGLDGMMIQLVAVDVAYPELYRARIALMQELLFDHLRLCDHVRSYRHERLSPEASTRQTTSHCLGVSQKRFLPWPHRATCTLFLAVQGSVRGHLEQHKIPCILLALCAGHFASADLHEQLQALRNVRRALQKANLSAHIMPPSSKNDEEFAIGTLDLLFGILATHEEYLVDKRTAGLVAQHLGLLCWSILRSLPGATRIRWSQLGGFVSLVQSAVIEQYASYNELMGFVALISRVASPSRDETHTELYQQYWECIAALLELCARFELASDISASNRLGDELVIKVAALLEDPQSSNPLLGTSYDAVISRILEVVIALGCWQHYSTVDLDPYIRTAEGLALLLCRRQRLQKGDAALVDRLFTGAFMKTRFCQLISGKTAMKLDQRRARRIMRFARHCAYISLEAMKLICDELETPSDSGSLLRGDGADLVARIRRGLLPGGELTIECAGSCCNRPSATAWLSRRAQRLSSAFTSNV